MSKFIEDSDEYWEERYMNYGNSGGGSYGRLAEFKAEVINNFTRNHDVTSIIDYGVGDGNNLKYYDLTNIDKYIGLDVSKTIIDRLNNDAPFKKCEFRCVGSNDKLEYKGDLVLSQDVLYHLIDETIYKNYLDNLFNMSKKYVIIYARDEDMEELSKHHMLVRKFTPYIRENYKSFELVHTVPNKYPYVPLSRDWTTSLSSFYIYEKVE